MERPSGVLGRAPSTRRRWRRTPAVVLALLVLAALVPTTAARAQESDGIELRVEAGYEGRYLVGRRLPVFVTIVADRLVRGVLEVGLSDQGGTWSTPVEVPGGTEKPVVVVLATPFGFAVRDVNVRLSGAGETVTASADVEGLESDELAGLLPSVTPADRPAPLALPDGFGTARFVEIDNDTLAVAGAVDPLGTIVAGPGELDTLDGTARRALLDWVDRGGRLVVDAQPGTAVPGLPDAWQPGERGRAAAGLGEVRLSGGAAAAGDWAAVIEPTPTVSLAETQILGGFSVPMIEPVGDSVARDAGLDALDLPWLLGFLAAYVILAGPVGYFAIRRRRPALGWVLIPALAVVFSGLAFVIGSDLRSSTKAAQGSVVESGAAGSRITTLVGTVSRSGGDGRATFPTGWTGSGVDTSFFGGPGGGAGEVAVTVGSDGAETTVPLAAGGFGVLRGTGPADVEGGLVVDARVEGDAIVGTVRNDHPFAVEEVGVFLGRAGDNLGRIEAGGSGTFELRGNEFRLNDPFFPAEETVWPDVGFQRGQPDLQNVVNLGILSEALTALGPNARPRGLVTAVGWTRSFDPPVEVGGESDPAGRTALMARAPVTTADGTLVAGSVWRELIRGPEGTELPDDDDLPGSVEGAIWRFTLPAGTGADPLAVDIPRYVARLDAWNGSAWITVDASGDPIDPNNFDGNIGRQRTVALPDEARQGDVVWVRGFLSTEFGTLDGAGLDLHTAGAPA